MSTMTETTISRRSLEIWQETTRVSLDRMIAGFPDGEQKDAVLAAIDKGRWNTALSWIDIMIQNGLILTTTGVMAAEAMAQIKVLEAILR